MEGAEKVLEAIQTLFDLSLAAKGWSDLSSAPVRYQLIHAYVRRILDDESLGSKAFSFLCEIAARMASEFTSSVDLPDIYRRWQGDSRGLKLLLKGQIIRPERGRCVFVHELFLSFFAAEHLLCAAPDAQALSDRLLTPRLAPLADLVIEAQTREDSVRGLLAHDSVSHSLLAAIESGGHGRLAQDVLMEELQGVLSACEQALSTTRIEAFEIERADQGRKTVGHRIQYPGTPSRYQEKLLFFLGSQAPLDRWLGPMLSVLARLDERVEAATQQFAAQSRARSVRSRLYDSMLHLAGDSNSMLRQLVHGACNRNGFGAPPVQCMKQWLERATELGPAALQFLCNFAHRCSLEGSMADVVADLLPVIVQVAWDHGWALGRFEALSVAQTLARSAKPEVRQELLRILHGLETKNFLLNGPLLELMEACGEPLEPYRRPDSVLEEVRAALAAPEAEDSRLCANRVYCGQFELLDAVSAPNQEAVEALADTERRRFFAMAALGSIDGSPWCMDCCLESAVVLPGAADDPLVRQALERWAAPPMKDCVFLQDAAAAFFHAHAGLAFLGLPEYLVTGVAGAREQAWNCLGRLIYQATCTTSSRASHLRGQAADCWLELGTRLLPESVGPFAILLSVDLWQRERAKHARRIDHVWPAEAGSYALKALERFEEWRADPFRELAVPRLARIAAALGTRESRRHLEALVDHPTLGHEAAAALRETARERS